MAQRTFGIEQKPQAENARGGEVATRTVPLQLGALLAPYRKQGRLSLRLERLHHLARLSAGRNNGDQSWSLTLDELEGLTYLLPENVGEHTLSLRIIGLNQGGATLAVLDHPVAARGTSGPAAQGAADPGAEREIRSLREELRAAREELAGAKTRLAASDAELQAARQKPPVVAPAVQPGNADLAAARAAWKAELDERLATAAAEAASDLERSRKVWQAEWSARLSSASKEAEARVEQRISEAQEAWRKDSEAALAKAGQVWKEEEAARFVGAETEWREKTASALAQARAEADAAKGQGNESERRLSEKVTVLEAKLEQKEAALARVQIAAEQAKEKAEADIKALLSEAESAWKTAESARLVAAEAQWKESAAKTLGELRAEVNAASGQASERERRLNEKVATLEGKLDEKETALARSEIGAEAAREQWQRETEAAFAKAKSAWQSEEAERLAAAEAQWKENSTKALNEARTAAEAVNGRASENERRLNEKIAFLETRVTERDTALARAGIAAEQAHEQWQRESEVALSKAKSAWKTEEAFRFAAAEAQWKDQSAKGLEQVRAEVGAARNAGAENERRLQQKLAALEEKLNERERDIARAGIAAEEERARMQREADAALAAARAAWKTDSEARLAETESRWRDQSQAALRKAQDETDAARRETDEAKQRLNQMARDADAAQAKAKTAWNAESAAKLAAVEARSREQLAAAAAQARAEIEAAQRRWQQESKEALAKAEAVWKADEASRNAQAEAQWRKRSAGQLAEATARFEAAETALSQLRKKNEAARQRADLDAVDRMHEEYRALQAARATAEQHDAPEETGLVSRKIVLKHSPFLSVDEPNADEQKTKRNRPVLDVTVAAAIAASIAFYFYPRVESYIPESVNSKIAMMTEGMNTVGQAPNAVAEEKRATAKAKKIATAVPKTVVANPVNMRSGPSADADVVATALGGAEVEKIEQQGGWTHIRIAGKNGKQEGWVNSAFLKDAGDKPPADKHD